MAALLRQHARLSRTAVGDAGAHRHAALLALAVLAALLLMLVPGAARGQVSVAVNIAPPALPVYEQPPLPQPGYLWAPGYWAYGPDGYYWVPGTWVEPPAPDLVWTPGFWGWSNGGYAWTPGYWAPVVGFYGGINYGYGYPGRGYYGGEWRNHQFFYNTAVDNVSTVNVTNIYSRTVVNNVTVNNVSYNGGPGGVAAQPTAEEKAAARGPHQGPTSAQTQHAAGARGQHELLASVNHGQPPIAATPKPGAFSAPHPTHLAQAPEAERPVPPADGGRPAPARPEAAPAPPRPPAAAAPHPGAAGHPAERPQAPREERPEAPPRPEPHGGGRSPP